MSLSDTPGPIWRKSTHSGGENCVELAVWGDAVYIRDSKNPLGSGLRVPKRAWGEFLDWLRHGA